MDKRDDATLLDRLLGLEAMLASLATLSEQLQASPNERVKTFAANARRHARGAQCAIAAVKQELRHSTT